MEVEEAEAADEADRQWRHDHEDRVAATKSAMAETLDMDDYRVQWAKVLHYINLERFALNKHSSLLD